MPPVRALVRLAMVSTMLGLGALPTAPALAQQDALKDTLYTSPTWGYTIRWHSAEWEVVDDLTSDGFNLLRLADDYGNVISFTGSHEYAGDAAACLDDMRAAVLAAPENLDDQIIEGEPDVLLESSDEQQAYVLLQANIPSEDVPSDLVLYLECQTLVPGEAVFGRTYAAPAGVFDQWRDKVADTLESVHLPASGWLPDDEDNPSLVWAGYAPLLDVSRIDATLFPWDSDDPQLLIGLVDEAGDTPVLVAPANLALTYVSLFGEAEDQIHHPYALAWEDGVRENADGSRTLAPGERATVHVQIAPIEATMACDAFPYLALEYRESADTFADITGDVGDCIEEGEETIG